MNKIITRIALSVLGILFCAGIIYAVNSSIVSQNYIKELKSGNAQLQTQINDLTASNTSLKDNNTKLQTQLDKLQKSNASLQSQVTDLGKKNSSLSTQVSNVTRNTSSLSTQVSNDARNSSSSSAPKIKQYTTQYTYTASGGAVITKQPDLGNTSAKYEVYCPDCGQRLGGGYAIYSGQSGHYHCSKCDKDCYFTFSRTSQKVEKP